MFVVCVVASCRVLEKHRTVSWLPFYSVIYSRFIPLFRSVLFRFIPFFFWATNNYLLFIFIFCIFTFLYIDICFSYYFISSSLFNQNRILLFIYCFLFLIHLILYFIYSFSFHFLIVSYFIVSGVISLFRRLFFNDSSQFTFLLLFLISYRYNYYISYILFRFMF